MRYAVGERLGAGGSAEVHRATDRRTGRAVALKRLRPGVDPNLLRREALALRMLRVPGVVQVLDHGTDAGGSYLVLELLEGEPFPALAPPVDWPSLWPVAQPLLRTLGQVHAAGVLHRDLKPANVLVTGRGPVLVDFGSAGGRPLGSLAAGPLDGTARYLAPEVLLGGEPSVAAEVYAVATMLVEAATGRIPHETVSERISTDPPPLDTHLPPRVAAALHAAIARDPTSRPASVPALAALLVEPEPLPWFGARTPLDQAIARLQRGVPARVGGRTGSGRSRAVAEIARGCGLPTAALTPSDLPFGSLPVAGTGATLDQVRDELRTALAGRVWVADRWDPIDRWTRALLLDARATFVAGVDGDGDCALGTVPPEALAPHFAGFSRIHHAPEDAAAAVWQATGGLRGLVAARVGRWIADGVAVREGGKVRVALELDAGPVLTTASAPPTGSASTVLRWLALAACPLGREALAALTGWTPWVVDGLVDQLVDGGWAIRGAGGVRGAWSDHRPSTEDEHLALARWCPRGAGRLRHRVAGRDAEGAAAEALALAAEAGAAARGADAARWLGDTLELLRVEGRVDLEQRVLTTWSTLAVRLEDLVLLDAARSAVDGAPTAGWAESLGHLLDAARAAALGDPEAASRALRGLTVAGAEEAIAGLAVKVALLRGEPPASTSADPARRANWEGLLAYRTGRYADAVAQFARAIRDGTPALRLSAYANGAAATLETGELELGSSWASAAVSLAAEARARGHEARAWVLARAVDYRRGRLGVADEELLAAVLEARAPDAHAFGCLTEAATAWRAGDLGVAERLAAAAAAGFRALSHPPGWLLAEALRHRAGGEVDVAELVRRAGDCPLPAVAVQVAALAGARPAWFTERMRQVHGPPELRREVLSPAECAG